ncbi:IS110 family transposase [Bradyrhizobium sp. ARR65]|uniref:IS110 family transposase n=1 Tax=Bradyrhizobium sp. ARR65 TaxID=1040989 RepID=UPI000687E3BB|nr:IS110 family transposase [Bradyrhizobium sp. ARR65]
MDASMQLVRARQQLLAFLLRHGRTYETGKHWTQRHRSWLAGQTFDQPAHQIVFQDYLEAVWTAHDRRDQPIGRISTMATHWSMGPLVEALRGLRGLDFISAATFVAAIGDLGRFENARQLMSYLGLECALVPSEQSNGERIRRGGITKTGNSEAARMPIEAAWSYRYPPRQGQGRDRRTASQDSSRHRLEGATSPLQTISHIKRSREEANRGGGRDCARALRLRLGDRPGGEAGDFIVALAPACLAGGRTNGQRNPREPHRAGMYADARNRSEVACNLKRSCGFEPRMED